MEFQQIVDELREYFNARELVDKQTYNAHGDDSWKFFDIRLLETLLFVRKKLGKGITINNWMYGGSLQQRGLRANVCDIVSNKTKQGRLYLSAHVLGKAIDFDVKGMTAVEVRDWLDSVADELPYKIRLEDKLKGKPISWVHLDVYDEVKNPKVYRFNV